MPLTPFQIAVLALLKSHRNPDSFIAGGIAIHRSNSSSRYSNDIDFFHDTDEAVSLTAQLDIDLLKDNSYQVQILINQPKFIRATVSKHDQSLKLEWVRDTAFRFYPVEPDKLLGYRLHDVDLAINKCLALANRSEVRDIIDLIALQESTIELGAACWAACGKDPGFTPALLIDCMRRNSLIRSDQLAAELLVKQLDPIELKKKWTKLIDQAETQLKEFPTKDLGCLYIDVSGSLIKSPVTKTIKNAQRHFGTVRGSWPSICVA
jgi:predicted nucleotidyltransferase component of viral defense system